LQVLAVAPIGVPEEPVMEALDLPAVQHLQCAEEDELLELDVAVDAVRRGGLEEKQQKESVDNGLGGRTHAGLWPHPRKPCQRRRGEPVCPPKSRVATHKADAHIGAPLLDCQK